jgi:pimeloyl-ACP methyl ester carboxylesterase
MTCSHGVPETTLARGGSGHYRASAGASVSSFIRDPGAFTTGAACDTASMSHQQTALTPDGTSIAWSRTGNGDPVVLVHGITESAASFDPVTALLAATHEVITLDLRGHGESGECGDTTTWVPWPATSRPWSPRPGAKRPHLVGHSLGGAVVTAVGSMLDVASVVDVDQSLQLDSFKAQLIPPSRCCVIPSSTSWSSMRCSKR